MSERTFAMSTQLTLPRETRQLPLVRVSGTHREMGRQIGEACRPQVVHSLENARNLLYSAYEYLQLTWEGAQIQARKYMPYAQERYPRYIEEMAGIAEGAGVTYDDIAVLNAMEGVTTDALHLTKCTSLAVNQDHTELGHVLIGHNEDWMPEDEQDVFIVAAQPDDEPPFMAMTYGGLLPNIGFNAYGIAQCCDSVYPNDCRIGIPRIIVSRAVLSARTPSEAMQHMLAPHRAAGYNHLLAHESGELYNVEVSARRFAILGAEDGYTAHTNNYHDPQMKSIEATLEGRTDSFVRYFRAIHLLKRTPQHTFESLMAIQSDHVNYQNSICNHAVDNLTPLDSQKTISAMLMDLTDRRLYATWGNPCQNEYHAYDLDS